jgi:hypothetical protein
MKKNCERERNIKVVVLKEFDGVLWIIIQNHLRNKEEKK